MRGLMKRAGGRVVNLILWRGGRGVGVDQSMKRKSLLLRRTRAAAAGPWEVMREEKAASSSGEGSRWRAC
jgi:hypothetical protein